MMQKILVYQVDLKILTIKFDNPYWIDLKICI